MFLGTSAGNRLPRVPMAFNNNKDYPPEEKIQKVMKECRQELCRIHMQEITIM